MQSVDFAWYYVENSWSKSSYTLLWLCSKCGSKRTNRAKLATDKERLPPFGDKAKVCQSTACPITYNKRRMQRIR